MSEDFEPLFLDWSALNDDQFELLCAELLRAKNFTDVEWFKGGNDRGRDLKALCLIPSPIMDGRLKSQEWIVECKHYLSRPIGPNDIDRALTWAKVHRPDVFAIMTSGHLSGGARDYVAELNDQRPNGIKIEYFEREDLEVLIGRYSPSMSRLLVASGPGEHNLSDSRAEISLYLLTRRPTRRAADIAALCRRIEALSGGNPERLAYLSLVCLEEAHCVAYEGDGISRTTHKMRLLNAGPLSVESDSFHFYGDVPVTDNRDLNLTTSGLQEPDGIEFTYDSGVDKKAKLRFVRSLPPGKIAQIEFSYDWPYPGPLAGPRYYAVDGLRYKDKLAVEIVLPVGFTVRTHIMTSSDRSKTRRERGARARRHRDGRQTLFFSKQAVPAWRSYYLSFAVEESRQRR